MRTATLFLVLSLSKCLGLTVDLLVMLGLTWVANRAAGRPLDASAVPILVLIMALRDFIRYQES